MWRYLTKRLGSMLVAFLGMTIIAFGLIRFIPVDPVEAYFTMNQIPVTEEALETMREEKGYNRPLLVQYSSWLLDVIRLDFGESFVSKKSVTAELLQRFSVTLTLAASAFIIIVSVSFTIGIWSATKRGGLIDWLSRSFVFTLASMPSFWLAFIFVYVVALKWGLLPLMGWGSLEHVPLPAFTLALGFIPYYIRLIRSSMLEEGNKPHVTFARARGVKESVIIRRHIVKGILPQLFTSLAMTCGGLLGGAAIIEIVFTISGVGRFIVESMLARDYFVLQGFIVIIGGLYIVFNFMADVLCAIVDPRVRLKGDGV
ncbi:MULTISPECIES: ABC transporter permease [unclassified Lysinibacillus]|uniref:ABC transporter permease n=1 Tax=unclassified Lysinibacillus TaxID=2636778 RepID=UPI0038141515